MARNVKVFFEMPSYAIFLRAEHAATCALGRHKRPAGSETERVVVAILGIHQL